MWGGTVAPSLIHERYVRSYDKSSGEKLSEQGHFACIVLRWVVVGTIRSCWMDVFCMGIAMAASASRFRRCAIPVEWASSQYPLAWDIVPGVDFPGQSSLQIKILRKNLPHSSGSLSERLLPSSSYFISERNYLASVSRPRTHCKTGRLINRG